MREEIRKREVRQRREEEVRKEREWVGEEKEEKGMDGCVWAWCQSQDGGTFGQGIRGKEKQMVCEPFIRRW